MRMIQKCNRFQIIVTLIAMLVTLLGQAGAVTATPTDAYEQMIERWSNQLTGGNLFNDTEPDTRAAIDKLTLNAQSLWGGMIKTPQNDWFYNYLQIR